MQPVFSRFLGVLSGLALVLTLTESALAVTPIVRAKAPRSNGNVPLCYVQMPGQPMQSLDKLCKVNLSDLTPINLDIDNDHDGVPDELLAEMRRFDEALRSAKNQDDYDTALQHLESRLPYSSTVRDLQKQQRDLQKYLVNARNDAQMSLIYRQLDSIQQRIYTDPSYTRVQAAMGKVYRVLNKSPY